MMNEQLHQQFDWESFLLLSCIGLGCFLIMGVLMLLAQLDMKSRGISIPDSGDLW